MIESDTVTIYPDGARSSPQRLIQVDDSHPVYFVRRIVGLEKIVQQRRLPGRWFRVWRKLSRKQSYNDLIHQSHPEDLIASD